MIFILGALFGIGRSRNRQADPTDVVTIQNNNQFVQAETDRELAFLTAQRQEQIEDRALDFRNEYVNPFEIRTQATVPFEIARRNDFTENTTGGAIRNIADAAGTRGLLKRSV